MSTSESETRLRTTPSSPLSRLLQLVFEAKKVPVTIQPIWHRIERASELVHSLEVPSRQPAISSGLTQDHSRGSASPCRRETAASVCCGLCQASYGTSEALLIRLSDVALIVKDVIKLGSTLLTERRKSYNVHTQVMDNKIQQERGGNRRTGPEDLSTFLSLRGAI